MDQNKNCSITFRVNEDEFNWIMKAAKSEELSQSSFIRKNLLKLLKENYPACKPEAVIYEPKHKVSDKAPEWLKKLARES